MSIIAFFPIKSFNFYNELWLNGGIYLKCTCLCWLKVQQYRQVVLILSIGSCQWYIIQTSSTQLWRYRVYRSIWGGALTSRWQLKWMNSSSDRPNIYTSPCVNGLFPLVQYRSWVSAFGQILSNEDEAILDCIIRLYFCPAA
jgi:hypothetical protein